ncbi:hypothetical protein NW755_012187 [Fusarium falciforme]|uniref:Aldehyde dehydrogenase domain-containing protein n=1 Tax=Fusarium falciforme TaxID=195108 RepID=A0A9W8QWD6_9HYPO|nr:hypothetical protein NW755_012187 [Fusarium falciforme]
MSFVSPEKIYITAQGGLLEGLLENAQTRKDQIYAVHAWLKEHSQVLVENLCIELGWSKAEAIEDMNTIFHSAEQLYCSLSLQADLRVEKSVKKGGQVSVHPRASGVALIVGSPRSPLSSVLLPFLSALAAGCTTISVPAEGANKMAKLISQCLTNTTNHQGVVVGHSQHLAYLTSQHFDVVTIPADAKYDDLIHRLTRENPSIRVLRPSRGKTFAIVDRSGDLASAAVHLHRVISAGAFRSSFRSPKVLLVDEFILNEFELRLGQLLAPGAAPIVNGTRPGGKANGQAKPAQGRGEIRSSKYSSKIAIFDRPDEMNFEVLRDTVSALFETTDTVVLVPTTSTENSIDLINAVNHPDLAPVLYSFSNSLEGEYFSKFVRAQQALINGIKPNSLTVEVPNTPTATLDLPYSVSDFSVNSPVYQVKPLGKGESPKSSVLVSKTLKKVKRSPFLGHSFFERGIVLGLVMALAGAGGSVYGAILLGKSLLGR